MKLYLTNLFLIKFFEIESELALADHTRSKYSIENMITDIISKIKNSSPKLSLIDFTDSKHTAVTFNRMRMNKKISTSLLGKSLEEPLESNSLVLI